MYGGMAEARLIIFVRAIFVFGRVLVTGDYFFFAVLADSFSCC